MSNMKAYVVELADGSGRGIVRAEGFLPTGLVCEAPRIDGEYVTSAEYLTYAIVDGVTTAYVDVTLKAAYDSTLLIVQLTRAKHNAVLRARRKLEAFMVTVRVSHAGVQFDLSSDTLNRLSYLVAALSRNVTPPGGIKVTPADGAARVTLSSASLDELAEKLFTPVDALMEQMEGHVQTIMGLTTVPQCEGYDAQFTV